VRALARRPRPDRAGVTWVAGTLEDPAALRRLAEGAAAVVHVAGVVNARDRAGFDAGNAAGTAAMLAAARAAGIDRFVHVSTLAAREPSLSDYGASKALAEDHVRASGLSWAIVRPPAVYGPRDREMLELFRMAARGIVLLPPKGRLSVIAAEDLVRLLLTLAIDRSGSVTYEPDDGRATGWDHAGFARALGVAVGRRVLPVSAPAAALRIASRIEGWVRPGKAKLTADRVRYFCHPDWVSTPHARPPAGLWRPEVLTPEGLRRTADWYRREGWLRG